MKHVRLLETNEENTMTMPIAILVACIGTVVPVVNPMGLTTEAESRSLSLYEGSLQPYLDGVGRVVPVTSFVGS